MTLRLAFYKGTRPGIPGVYNRLVRARAKGQYSHVEMVFSDGWSASSSFADGGTRFKLIEFKPEHWDFIELPAEWEAYARLWFVSAAYTNAGYDLLGNIHIALGFIADHPNKHFCSESIAKALKIDGAFRFEPNMLFTTVIRLVQAYQEGQLSQLKAA